MTPPWVLLRLVATAVVALLLAGGSAATSPVAADYPAVTGPTPTRWEHERDDEAGPFRLGALVRAVTHAALSLQRSTTSELGEPHGLWHWPLRGQHRVVKHFDPPDQPWLPGHRGIDIAGLITSPVLAVDAGTVTYSGSIAGVGIVSVTHGDGIRSTYQPVSDRISRGTQVRAGDRIGQLGELGSHCLLRACLHLGAVRGERDYLDPMLLLQAWELSLLPHGP